MSKNNTITFPSKTAQEIIDESNNQINEIGGGPIIYSDWMKNEPFYTTEKCRPRTIEIPTDIMHPGKSWTDCAKEIGEENMLNFPEVVYLLRESEAFRDLLRYPNKKSTWWTWTSSRCSGGRLVFVGNFDSDGAFVSRWAAVARGLRHGCVLLPRD